MLVSFSACGYRTPPAPYASPESSLPVVSQAALKRQGNNWVFSWEIPGAKKSVPTPEKSSRSETDASSDIAQAESDRIKQFRINIFKAAQRCPACSPEPAGQLLVDSVSGNMGYRFADVTKDLPSGARFHAEENQQYRFYLPVWFIRENGFTDDCFFTVDYILTSGLHSVPSPGIYPLHLKEVPPPEIKVRTSVSEGLEPETFLLLEWELQQEILRHTLQKDGKATETVVHYGLNLYHSEQQAESPSESESSSASQFSHTQRPVNPSPLLYGSFSLLNFQGRLIARQVDRYGNESIGITVFEEKQ